MAERLASVKNVQDYLKGGAGIVPATEQYTALVVILEGLSRAMMTEILGSPQRSLKQASAVERYGNEHYGRHRRDRIRLRRFPVVSISSVDDDGDVLDASEYRTNAEAAILYRLSGKFTDEPLAVQVTYVAGYAETGSEAAPQNNTLSLAVPADLRNACLEQLKHLWSEREPGGAISGATTISRPDGSVVFESVRWLKSVAAVLKSYKR